MISMVCFFYIIITLQEFSSFNETHAIQLNIFSLFFNLGGDEPQPPRAQHEPGRAQQADDEEPPDEEGPHEEDDGPPEDDGGDT